MTEAERRSFVAPSARGEFDGIDLSMLDPGNPEERRLLILAEHPDLERAIRAGQTEIHAGGQMMNPSLHIAMDEIVANQLWDDTPPEMWQTARRLLEADYERHEVLHMLASVVSSDVHRGLHDGVAADPERTRAALAALPESWERDRADIGTDRHLNQAKRRAAAKRRHPDDVGRSRRAARPKGRVGAGLVTTAVE